MRSELTSRSCWISLFLCVSLAPFARGLERQPASEYHARRVAVANKIPGGVTLIFGADEPSLEYESWRQDEDFYYLTGWDEPGAALLVETAIPATTESE